MIMDYGQSVKYLCFMDYNIMRGFYKEKGFTFILYILYYNIIKRAKFYKKLAVV